MQTRFNFDELSKQARTWGEGDPEQAATPVGGIFRWDSLPVAGSGRQMHFFLRPKGADSGSRGIKSLAGTDALRCKRGVAAARFHTRSRGAK